MKVELEDWKKRLEKPLGLASQLKMSPDMRAADIDNFGNKKNLLQSAVLILLYKKNGCLQMLLTKRSTKLNKHRGQISFPGGKKDDSDLDLLQTAIREAREEVGLNSSVEVLGELTPLMIPITNFCVHSFVSYIPHLPSINFNTDEVESVLEVSVKALMQKDNVKYKNFGKTSSGRLVNAPYYDVNGVEIWGATAMIISELIETLFVE